MRGSTFWAMVTVMLAAAAGLTGCSGQSSMAVGGPQAVQPVHHRGLDPVARVAISRLLGANDPRYFVSSSQSVRSDGVTARFARAEIVVHSAGVAWRLAAPAVRPVTDANRVTYAGGRIREWFASGPLGLEQGFTIDRPVPGGTLTLAVGRLPAGVGVRVAASARDATLVRDGRALLRYTGLAASDRAGRALNAAIVRAGGGLAIRVDVRGAQYPVTVDPLVQSAKITSGDAGGGLGSGALAISGDTIVAGASQYPDGAKDGAVYVFDEPSGGWANLTTYTARLTNGNTTSDSLGQSVAIDGDTIVAGAHGSGYADVFVEPTVGGWATTTTPTAVLSDSSTSGSDSGLGQAVAVSGDTIAVGDPANGGGAGMVDVYVRPGPAWTGDITTPTVTLRDSTTSGGGAIESNLGHSVAISGSTIIAGAPLWRPNNTAVEAGAAEVFVKPGASWSSSGATLNQVAILTPAASSYSGPVGLGWSVAYDGGSVIAGAPSWQPSGGGAETGAAYVFTEGSSGWTNATQALLTPSDGVDSEDFGQTVGISGNVAVVGGPNTASDEGEAYVYREPSTGWANATEDQKLTAGDAATNAQFGNDVAIDSSTVVAAAQPGHDGSVYVFGDAALSITTSSLAGGTVGTAYSASLSGSGGTAPYTWSATGLPAGVSINASTGALTGTPTTAGNYTPTFTLTDAYGTGVSHQLALTVAAATTTSTTPTTPTGTTPTPTGTTPTTTTSTTLTDTTPPTITGKLAPHQVLTCHPGTWSVAGATFTYAWFAIEPVSPTTDPLALKLKAKSIGVKNSPSLVKLKVTAPLPKHTNVLLLNGPTYPVPFLDQPLFVFCEVTASASGQSATANSVTEEVQPGPPELAGPTIHNQHPARPKIRAGVGVGSTNVCTPGDWLGAPTFKYDWYTVATAGGKVILHLGSGSTLKIDGDAEGQLLQCRVTATSKYGSAKAWSNAYSVPKSAPVSTADPEVTVTSRLPSGSAVVGDAGGAVIGELVDLTCGRGVWNRTDLSYSYTWTIDRWPGFTTTGQTIHLDMRPGKLQYDLQGVHCQVTATTSHGLSGTATSGPVDVWNGCEVWYTDVEQTDDPVDTHIGGPMRWLYATDPNQLFDYDEAAGNEVVGVFGLAGGDFEQTGFSGNEERPHRAETDGPNCGDYGRYLDGQGYDVKQGPNPDGDQFWIEHGSPFF